ncbi:MAG: mannose-6-phosphate isomerase [Acidobacteria bacterium]|nr:mannose-6-phosphate isomerase [Acidobacteriota bacterium]
MPAKVIVSKAGVKSNEPMIVEAQQVEAALPGIIANVLQQSGCQVLPDPFTSASLEQNTELRYALADLQSQFDKLSEQFQKKPKDVRKGRFTLGDEVLKLNPGSADALIFVRANGYLSTGGKKVFAALVGGPGLYENVFVSIAVVDARTGALLYLGRSLTMGNFAKNTESMAKPIEKSFKNFAKAAKVKKT